MTLCLRPAPSAADVDRLIDDLALRIERVNLRRQRRAIAEGSPSADHLHAIDQRLRHINRDLFFRQDA